MGMIAENIESVRARIAQAAARVGRDPAEVTLVAVSKTHPLAQIVAAYDAGQRDFGENRLEELLPKMEQAKMEGLDEIRWHLIGPIQSRKTKLAIGPITLIHAVDRLKIAARLSRDAEAAGVQMPVLLEVNVSGEATKHGFTVQDAAEVMPTLLTLPGIQVQGLMTMAPFVDDVGVIRPVFAKLRQLRDELCAHLSGLGRELSMGMTNDFEIAVEEGATLVRVGSAIFGVRRT